ncbi:hypothetical protein DIPPA_18774 [Diplonema papillatum]|nr:hypothetical protein DIPPA_18774 [Diplonema papillatum]
MGTCCSKRRESSSTARNSRDANLLQTDQLPTFRGWAPSAGQDASPAELERQREIFWDTQPAYGGKQEIWDALKSVLPLPVEDEGLALAILQAAEIKFPRGTWSDIYDTTGFKYELPDFVISDPTPK